MIDPTRMARLAAIEQQFGLPKSTLLGMYGVESNYGRAKDRPGSQFQGAFQLGNAVRRQYGISNPQDFEQSAIGAAKYAVDNRKILQKAIGREPTAAELYLAHQQGPGGALKLLRNPDQPAGMLTNPTFIRSNAGDPNAPAAAFVKNWEDKFAQKTNPMGQAMAFTGDEQKGPMDPAGQAIQSQFGAPGSDYSEADKNWEAAGNIGNSLMMAGAALMARDNPSGASALMSGVKSAQKDNDWSASIHNGQLVRYNKKTGALQSLPIPGFKPEQNLQYKGIDTDEKGQSFDTFVNPSTGEVVRKPTNMRDPAFKAEDVTSDPEVLKTIGNDWLINGNQGALKELRPGKERTEAIRLAKEEYEKNTGTKFDSTDLAIRRGAYKELLAESSKFGQMLAPTETAHNRLKADIEIAKEAIASISDKLNTGPLRWNQFMQMTSKELQDAGYVDLAKAKEAIYSVERGYSSVQASGMRGGDTVTSQNRAKDLINSAMTPDVLLGQVGKDGKRSGGLLDFMGSSSDRIIQSVKDGQKTLREEWKKGANSFAGKTEAILGNTSKEIDAEIDKRIGKSVSSQEQAPAQQAPQQAPQWTREQILAEIQRRKRAAGQLTGTMKKAQ